MTEQVNAPQPGAPEVTFANLGISAPTLAGLRSMGITTPTPVQAQSIPPLTRCAACSR